MRHTINAAMSFLPTRQAFLQGLAGPSVPTPAPGAVPAAGGAGELTPGTVEGKLGTFLSAVEPVRAELWRTFTQLGLTQLP